MAGAPDEARKLLAVEPAAFVAERKRLAKQLREEGRAADAKAVEELKKPPPTVLAVNRAARDRPRAAEGAARAAELLRKAQLRNDQATFEKARRELQQALDLLAEVAIAHVAPSGKTPSDAMRRRVYDLLRSALADDASRRALVDGSLTEEVETTGFEAFAGMTFSPPKKQRGSKASRTSASKRRERELRRRLSAAKRRLAASERAVREAEGARAEAEKDVAAVQADLDRL